MSLISLLFDDYPIHHHRAPRRELTPLFHPEEALQSLVNVLNQLPQVEKDTSITVDKDHFQAKIDVQQFKPEELTVKLNDDNTVTVEGKHEEKQDEHGFISRHFVRKYVLPDDVDAKKLQSALSSDGVLSLAAPKKPEVKQVDYKQIPILRTGPIGNKKTENQANAQKEG
ncbi:heat shock protein 27-like [Euwallacea similis]|uniref:heat shock protein 27-like n=1 Tax=Euwallacea similis TaxID=1736056 RepID=UPI003450B197